MCPLLAGMQSGPRMASASLCGLRNVAADKRSADCATLRAALPLPCLQLNLGVGRTDFTYHEKIHEKIIAPASISWSNPWADGDRLPEDTGWAGAGGE
jgi:hypothetical protein